MARKVFFSFHYERDSWRVSIVRNSGILKHVNATPFYDKAEWEAVKKKTGIQQWIDDQMNGTSVTVVLIGAETANRPWVQYEIEQSVEKGKGLLGIDISKIRNRDTTPDGK